MSFGAGLRQVAANTDSQRAPKFRRRSLGLLRLIGLLVIPLLIAATGCGAFGGPAAGPPSVLPTSAPSTKSGAPKFSLAPLSISRSGNNITLTGDFPDDSAKADLMKVLNGSLPAGVKIIDRIQINPDVDALDFSNAGPLFKDSASIADFNLNVNADTITLAGTAASQDQKNTLDNDAKHIWSNLNVRDNLVVNGPTPPTAGRCADLQTAINAATGGPITFANNGFIVSPAEEQALTQVADMLKACPSAHASVNGYTDNFGSEAINVPLSNQRAQAIADFLVAHGVAADQLLVKGLGSANPVAPNNTAAGRAKNRRVEIVVG